MHLQFSNNGGVLAIASRVCMGAVAHYVGIVYAASDRPLGTARLHFVTFGLPNRLSVPRH